MHGKPGPAAMRGSEIHLKAEHFLSGSIRGLPTELKKLAPEYTALKKAKPMLELKLAVDNAWKPVNWDYSWGRGIVDALARKGDEMIIIDHKTGRIYQKHIDQAQVYACLTAANVEDAQEFQTEFWYTDWGQVREWHYTRKEVEEELMPAFEERVMVMHTAKKFPKTPSQSACMWCPDRTDKGGKCREWRGAK